MEEACHVLKCAVCGNPVDVEDKGEPLFFKIMSCPVCKKSGLTIYRNISEIICPCCQNDMFAFVHGESTYGSLVCLNKECSNYALKEDK